MHKFLLTVLVFTCHIAAAQTSGETLRSKDHRKAIARAEKYIDSLFRAQALPGLSISVGNKNGVIWAQGFGFADMENKVPVTPASRFRMGSISKLLTSLAVGKLVQQGRLDLDAPVSAYLPAFPSKQYGFTSRQLAGHTAGIRHYKKSDPISVPKWYANVTESMGIFKNDSLQFQPGTAYNYSTYGYTILSGVVETASGKDFLSYMLDSVFAPAGMASSVPDYNDSIIPHRVRFYERRKEKIVNAALVDNSYKWAGGGFLSTPSDLVNMVRGLFNHTFLDENTVKLLFTPQQLADGKSTGVGIAWRINTSRQGRVFVHHGGQIDGGRTFVFAYPESGYIVAMASNLSAAGLNVDEASAVLSFFLEGK